MKVLCTTSCYIDRYYEEGREYPEYNGPASPHLQPIDEADAEETMPAPPAARARKNANPVKGA